MVIAIGLTISVRFTSVVKAIVLILLVKGANEQVIKIKVVCSALVFQS